MKQNDKGIFLVFEGIDGAGKTTQIQKLASRLTAEGYKVVTTAEPTQSATGGLLREALEGRTSRTLCELAALFTADRVAHNVNPKSGIRKMLKDGYIVISDRYYYSTMAYQGFATDFEWVKNLNLGCPEIVTPDLCIFLDLTPEASLARIQKNRATTEIFENKETLTSVRDNFFATFKSLPDKVQIIDADHSPEEVAGSIYSAVYPLL